MTPSAPPRAAALVASVALGGAVGALLRAAQGEVVPGHGPTGPLASTLVVNVVGSLALGALLGLTRDGRGPALARPLVGVGVYGAYTTFATFEAVALRAAGTGDLVLFLVASLVLGLAAAHAGQRVGERGPRALAVVALVGPLVALAASALATSRLPGEGGSLEVALAVGVGGAIGALCRAGAALIGARASRVFPWGTLSVNVVGSFLIGLLRVHGAAQAFVVTGLLGGLTTFSTFACETLRLSESGRRGQATLYVVANVALGLAAAALGSALSARG